MPLTYQSIKKYSKHTKTKEKIEPGAFLPKRASFA